MLSFHRKAIVTVIVCVVFGCAWFLAVQGGVFAQSDDTRDEGDRTAILRGSVGKSNANATVLRTKVPGGWFVLVRQVPLGKDATASDRAFYYPDPQRLIGENGAIKAPYQRQGSATGTTGLTGESTAGCQGRPFSSLRDQPSLVERTSMSVRTLPPFWQTGKIDDCPDFPKGGRVRMLRRRLIFACLPQQRGASLFFRPYRTLPPRCLIH